MKKHAKWAAVPAAAVIVAILAMGACQVSDMRRSDDLASDLALVAAADLELARQQASRVDIASPLEAGSGRAPSPRRKRGPEAPAAVEVLVSEQPVPEPIPVVVSTPVAPSPEPVATEVATSNLPPLPRPRPIEPRFPSGDGGGWGGGEGGGGSGTGTVVIRGGTTGRDPCIPRSTGGVPVPGSIGVLINERGPVIRPTFPRMGGVSRFPRR